MLVSITKIQWTGCGFLGRKQLTMPMYLSAIIDIP